MPPSIYRAITKYHNNKILNLSRAVYSYDLKIPLGTMIEQSELVQGLETLANQQPIEVVDVSGHRELRGLEFSRFRKHLPSLKTLIFRQVMPNECDIEVEQFAKCIAKGIHVEMDEELNNHINKNLKAFLLKNGQSEEDSVVPKDTAQAALNYAKEKSEHEFKASEQKQILQNASDRKEWEQLQEQWKTKDHLVFDVESLWVINGPTSADIFKGSGMETELFALYLLITKYKLWDEVKKGPGENGFMFSHLPKLDEVITYHPVNRHMGHSGASYGWAMRVMERIANDGKISINWK